jgi:hypothetical protein
MTVEANKLRSLYHTMTIFFASDSHFLDHKINQNSNKQVQVFGFRTFCFLAYIGYSYTTWIECD